MLMIPCPYLISTWIGEVRFPASVWKQKDL